MKNLFFSLALLFVGALSATASHSTQSNLDVVNEEMSSNMEIAPMAACWEIQITVSCGGTYNTQYCNEGLHGTLAEWVMQVDSWACPEGGDTSN